MDYVSDPSELLKRFRKFAFGSTVPEGIADRLQSIPGTDADVICSAAEILYAHRDQLDDDGLRVMGELFNYGLNQHWSTFNQGDRSAQIVAATDKALGDARGKAPADKDWPAPKVELREGVDWRNPEGDSPEPPAGDAPAE